MVSKWEKIGELDEKMAYFPFLERKDAKKKIVIGGAGEKG